MADVSTFFKDVFNAPSFSLLHQVLVEICGNIFHALLLPPGLSFNIHSRYIFYHSDKEEEVEEEVETKVEKLTWAPNHQLSSFI